MATWLVSAKVAMVLKFPFESTSKAEDPSMNQNLEPESALTNLISDLDMPELMNWSKRGCLPALLIRTFTGELIVRSLNKT